ncbi:hypothetical protein ASL14_19190 [Paenibacillus sp. IHB B 3084]|uniref:hypothetical protein n=1 Tax=Paenibacillus sp. IHB B 3084 TaxID=867076 RepID=UPI00071F2974|nr:hypothetical protein [Paenibacillus sp. IHB B 3084]ALP37996.1 hypothetical protein ASL14_19190 [Paenibacillus sp. IHB B 3084]
MNVRKKIIEAMEKRGFTFGEFRNSGHLYFSKEEVAHRVNPASLEFQVCNSGLWVTIGTIHEWL